MIITLTKQERKAGIGLLKLFNIKGKRADLAVTDGQLLIFCALVFRKKNRLHIASCTQYGKSEIIAIACVVISCLRGRMPTVVAPTGDKAKIIMRYYIDHLSDSYLFEQQLEKHTKLERLKQEGSKRRIILRNGGGIFALSCDARSLSKGIEAAMGEGTDTVIEDESALIPDEIEATIFRMIAGQGTDGLYCKIGNPFNRNHFYKSSISKRYGKIDINYKQAIKEGRYTREFIEEAKTKPLFDILYENKFPDEEEIDSKGFRRLFAFDLVENSIINKKKPEKIDKLGIDVGRGGNYTSFAGRKNNLLWIAKRNQSKDLMSQIDVIKKLKAEESIIDDVGIGGGLTDRCEEIDDIFETAFKGGGRCPDEDDRERFKNNRAMVFHKWKKWLEKGGKMIDSKAWQLLPYVKYKITSDSRIIIESKEDFKERTEVKAILKSSGSDSPDDLDAGSMTFYEDERPSLEVI